MRWNPKRREQASQKSLSYVRSTVWTAQRCSWSYTEKRREEKRREEKRREEKREEGDRGGQEDKRGESNGEIQIQPVISSLSVLHRLEHIEIHRVE